MTKLGIAIIASCISFATVSATLAAQPEVMSARWTSAASVAATVPEPTFHAQEAIMLSEVVITADPPATVKSVTSQPKKPLTSGCVSYPMYASGEQHVKICQK